MNEMLDAALSYIEQGFKVFPVKPDKRPLTHHGLKDSTQTKAGVCEYWERWPDAGIALVTDDLLVLDFDVKNGGLGSKAAIEARYGSLPRTRIHRTGGGGEHWIYRNPNGANIRNTVSFAGYPGVDLRANGGYIVVPPSPHESGKSYEVIDNSAISPAPDWLIGLATTKRKGLQQTSSKSELLPEGERNSRLTSIAGGDAYYPGVFTTQLQHSPGKYVAVSECSFGLACFC
jgi:hypothetical protein